MQSVPLRGCFLICLLVISLALAACSPVRGLEAWELLNDLAAGGGPSGLKESAPEPRREAIAYEVAGRAYRGDLYRPGEGPGAPLVLVPGAARAGKDDPRLVALAMSLARSRFLVLVPDIASLRQLNVSAADAVDIAAAVSHLAARAGPTEGRAVGLVAISYAVGPAVIAALTLPAREHLRFLVGVGGYHDLEAVVTFFTTDRFRETPGAAWQTRKANAYGKWVFVRSNAGRLEDPRDRRLLTAMATRKLNDLAAPIDDMVRKLGPEGRAVQALLANRDPEAVPGLIAGLPPGIRHEIAALDLKTRDLTALQAEVILLHGRDDPIIPESESRALAAALAATGAADRVHLYLPESLAHADFEASGAGDAAVLLPAAYRLLRLRDAVLESMEKSN